MHAPAAPIIPSSLLVAAYRGGIFPMADSREDTEIFWVEPRERAILPLDGFRCSRSLAKIIRQERFRVTCNTAFSDVIHACAQPRAGHPESWISQRIMASYRALHAEGHAHSIECWQGGQLAGGLYGVGFDGVFCGESMFSNTADASKVALSWLVTIMRRAGAQLLDCQFMTDHLSSLGAVEISQARYLELLSQAQNIGPQDVEPQNTERAAASTPLQLPQAYGALLASAEDVGLPPGKFIAQSLTQTS